jgi:NADH-quinone oxidoreductase subunit E
MKRYDLRPLKDNFYDRMFDLIKNDINEGENGIFLFEVGDFSPIQKVADMVKENNYTLMNSLKFNEVDWTVVIKKAVPTVEKEIEEVQEASVEE